MVKERLFSIQKYGEARRAIEGTGLKNPDDVLAHRGFTVQWKGLDISIRRLIPPPNEISLCFLLVNPLVVQNQ